MTSKSHSRQTRSPKVLPIPNLSGKVLYNIPHIRQPHERELAQRLTRFGHNLIFIKESKLKNIHTPDCIWHNDEYWEMKTIFGDKTETIHRALKSASNQSRNIIIDIARSPRDIERSVRDVISYYRKRSRGAKNKQILIIDQEKYCFLRPSMLQ